MVGLLDIAPLTRTVTVNGTPVEVTGVSVTGIAVLMQEYPAIIKLITGGGVSTDEIIKLAPEAIAAIIAAGTGTPGNKQAESVAGKLSLEAQVDLLDAIIKMTMPGGFGPFVDRLTGLFGTVTLLSQNEQSGSTGTEPDTSSPKPSKD